MNLDDSEKVWLFQKYCPSCAPNHNSTYFLYQNCNPITTWTCHNFKYYFITFIFCNLYFPPESDLLKQRILLNMLKDRSPFHTIPGTVWQPVRFYICGWEITLLVLQDLSSLGVFMGYSRESKGKVCKKQEACREEVIYIVSFLHIHFYCFYPIWFLEWAKERICSGRKKLGL